LDDYKLTVLCPHLYRDARATSRNNFIYYKTVLEHEVGLHKLN